MPWHPLVLMGSISASSSSLPSSYVPLVTCHSFDEGQTLTRRFAQQVHKAPTALGLTSSLLAQSRTKSSVQRSLVLFSLASPFGAVLTYGVISLLSGGGLTGTESDRLMYWAGCSLLFSAGTFVSVSVVCLPAHSQILTCQDVLSCLSPPTPSQSKTNTASTST